MMTSRNTSLQTAAVVVCERSGRWAAAWRRAAGRKLAAASVQVVEVRSLDECPAALAGSTGALLLLEATSANWSAALELLDRLDSELPAVRVVVVMERRLARLAPLVRELGAIEAVTSPRALAPLVDVAARYFASLPRPEQTLEQTIHDRLPWMPVAKK